MQYIVREGFSGSKALDYDVTTVFAEDSSLRIYITYKYIMKPTGKIQFNLPKFAVQSFR